MKKIKKIMTLILSFIMVATMSGCKSKDSSRKDTEITTINVAYQYGLAYAPLIIVQQNKIIENAYKEATGKEVKVVWTQMSSGADINVAIASGNIDVGFMGIAPAISGVMNDVGYKIFTNVSGQEHGIVSNDKSVKGLEDLVGTDRQIALVNLGSIQHIILARALKNAGYDAHALDSNIVVMKHPDGMTALQSGNVSCQLTTNPYIYKEREDDKLYEIDALSEVWTKDNSFIVGVASEKVYKNDKLYDVLCSAFSEGIEYINNDVEKAAAITYEYDGNSLEDEIKYIQKGTYSVETTGVFELAVFMAEEGFIDKAPDNYECLVYDNVKGD